jgi:hypothetical protein
VQSSFYYYCFVVYLYNVLLFKVDLLCCRSEYSILIEFQVKRAYTQMTNPRLKASVRDEPKQMLQPISGYEEEPLLSIEEVCKPLEKILDKELPQNMFIAKTNSAEPEDKLTQDESASIHLYTMEWKKSENSLYAVLNRTLRMADRRQLQPWFRYLKLFLTAFFKLP